MQSYQIRKAVKQDVPRLAEISALAFENDPLTNWLVEDKSETLQMERQMFLAEYRISHRFDMIYTDVDRNGVAVWKPPTAHFTLWDRMIQFESMLGTISLNRRALAKIRLFLAIENVRPKEPHYYLSLLAVVPEMHGKGLGSALMQPTLDRCDQEGIPAYLETETESNVHFYEKKGFKVQREIVTTDGASKVWTLWREAESKKGRPEGDPFIPTPTQTVPGLESIVVQAIENLYPDPERQKKVFKYALEYIITCKEKIKRDDTNGLLAILAYSNGRIESLPSPSLWFDGRFRIEEIDNMFPKMKNAEEWVKSITKNRT